MQDRSRRKFHFSNHQCTEIRNTNPLLHMYNVYLCIYNYIYYIIKCSIVLVANILLSLSLTTLTYDIN